jgi:hypothetical protein
MRPSMALKPTALTPAACNWATSRLFTLPAYAINIASIVSLSV